MTMAGQKLFTSYLDDIQLYGKSTEELQTLIFTASNFVKKPNKPAAYHGPPSSASVETCLHELMAVFVSNRKDYSPENVELLDTLVSYTCTKGILLLQMFLHCMRSRS